jgi:tetratricopeptide (TPR) repeat protein
MVAPSRNKKQIFSFVGIGFGLLIASFLSMSNMSNNSTSVITSQSSLLANNTQTVNPEENHDLTSLDKRKTLQDAVNVNISSELKETENPDEIKDFLAKTDLDSLVKENQSPKNLQPNDKLNAEANPAKLYYDRGLVYSIYQKYSEAIASYNRALTLNPQLTLGYYHRGIAREKLGNLKGAIQDFQKAQSLAQAQNDPTALEMVQQKLDYLVK